MWQKSSPTVIILSREKGLAMRFCSILAVTAVILLFLSLKPHNRVQDQRIGFLTTSGVPLKTFFEGLSPNAKLRDTGLRPRVQAQGRITILGMLAALGFVRAVQA